jgi:hypothetical protein
MSLTNLDRGTMMRPMELNDHPLRHAPTLRIIATSALIFMC